MGFDAHDVYADAGGTGNNLCAVSSCVLGPDGPAAPGTQGEAPRCFCPEGMRIINWIPYDPDLPRTHIYGVFESRLARQSINLALGCMHVQIALASVREKLMCLVERPQKGLQ